MDFKREVLSLLKMHVRNPELEIPSNPEFGDYAFPCFSLAKELKKAPNIIAQELNKKIKPPKFISRIEAKGPYLNFFINKNILSEITLNKILKERGSYGSSKNGNKKTIVIDMSSPNIAKPFGIGHLRSTIIGNSLANIHKKLGYKTIKINYLGDWGTQFGRLIVGYKRFGNLSLLKKDPIKHLLDIYVKTNKEEYEEEARSWFKKLENNNKEAIKIWKSFKELSINEFKKIYKTLNINFDVLSGESFYNKKAISLVNELKRKKLLELSEDAYIIDLKKYDLGVFLIQKKDGATLYSTRDLAAAIDRYKKYKFISMLYEVGSEQKLYFKQLFKILELLNYKWSNNCIHVEHGLYLDKDGKKFATRHGKIVFMEDILNKTIELAKKTIQEKNPRLRNKEEAARKIAIAAIFYGDLRNNRINNIIFDIQKFLDFEGDTGPYLQYSYARAVSILRKAKKPNKIKITNLSEKEISLIKKLAEFPDIIKASKEHLNPSITANYALKLAHDFNEFYHSAKVIGSEEESQKLAIVIAFSLVIKEALSLLGIEVLEEM